MTRPQFSDGGESLQICRVAANKVLALNKGGPRFEFSGNCENKRTSIARLDTCSLSSCVHTRTSTGDKLPPVGRRRCLRSADDEGRLRNSARKCSDIYI
jgi:hypothetical protein